MPPLSNSYTPPKNQGTCDRALYVVVLLGFALAQKQKTKPKQKQTTETQTKTKTLNPKSQGTCDRALYVVVQGFALAQAADGRVLVRRGPVHPQPTPYPAK